MAWNDLSIKDKHQIIKVGVQNGLRSMSEIRDAYNKFEDGGVKAIQKRNEAV